MTFLEQTSPAWTGAASGARLTDVATPGDRSGSVDTMFRAYEERVYRGADRLFLVLLLVQWVFGILIAGVLSPYTWDGATRSLHPHFLAAIILGGACAGLPIHLIRTLPGALVTRLAVAVGQVGFSALLIHLTGGRIETHFHVFGSLAFLTCYRDRKVLFTATAVVALDHLLRGLWYPESVYGVTSESAWRTLEHSGWVVFEVCVLTWMCTVSRREMRSICEQQHRNTELLNALEDRVRERTHDLEAEIGERQRAETSLRASEERFRTLVENAPIGIFRQNQEGRVEMANPTLIQLLGLESVETLAATGLDRFRGPIAEGRSAAPAASGDVRGRESVWRRSDGAEIHVRENGRVLCDAEGRSIGYEGTVEDVTGQKRVAAELKAMNLRLLEASRQTGMAEVATGVLHNVGNVLNSVNVSATLIGDGLRSLRLAHLDRLVALFDEHRENLGAFFGTHPKGRQVPAFLAALANDLTEGRRALTEEARNLQHNVDHIKQIVVAQQAYAKVSGVTERIDVAALVDDALRLGADSLTRHHIEVVRDYQSVPEIVADRHKALQILINLVSNAKHALEHRTEGRRLTVRIHAPGPGIVRIEVTDNGVGIPRENLTRLFQHGFTTRRDGHGFGLHSGAIAAKELSGKLSVHSEGAGCGATFQLELPVHFHPDTHSDP